MLPRQGTAVLLSATASEEQDPFGEGLWTVAHCCMATDPDMALSGSTGWDFSGYRWQGMTLTLVVFLHCSNSSSISLHDVQTIPCLFLSHLSTTSPLSVFRPTLFMGWQMGFCLYVCTADLALVAGGMCTGDLALPLAGCSIG